MTRRCPPVEKKPDAEFWKQVRRARFDVEMSIGVSAEQYEQPHLADGTAFTAAPRGIPFGNGCYRNGQRRLP